MTYTPVVWQNLVTPVDQVHLNQMDNGIVALDTGKVDKDGVVAAASGIVQNKLAAGEATNFQLLGSGQLSWGPGGVGGALDVTLRRVAASDLKAFASYFRTSGDIIARDGLAGQVWLTSSIGGGGVYFGAAADTNLYRASAGSLKTDGIFIATGRVTPDSLGSGTRDGTKFLRDDGTWQTVTGGGGALPADTVIAAATRIIANKLLAGDAQPVYRLMGDGKQEWGPGGASAPDTNLYRAGAGILVTNAQIQAFTPAANFAFSTADTADNFFRVRIQAGGGIQSGGRADATEDNVFGARIQAAGVIQWGSGAAATDTNLYRSAANVLKTDGEFFAQAGLRSSAWVMANNGSVANQLFLAADGKIYFGSAADTYLYRKAAQVLTTGWYFTASGNIVARDGAASQVNMGALGTGESGLIFGSAGDTNLYRTAASNLRTDGALDVGSCLWFFGADTSTARVWFGSALDTSLYRSAASVLKTDGALSVANV